MINYRSRKSSKWSENRENRGVIKQTITNLWDLIPFKTIFSSQKTILNPDSTIYNKTSILKKSQNVTKIIKKVTFAI
ncbi:unnamed protein product [Meloidogyne enterolobii]|uniref:Uncharacterized protein n=1 Tax=Meloidogyne enterolobii TaxID=390850 RepID=A0ACB1A6E2_MELEN